MIASISAFFGILWFKSVERQIESNALGETRAYRIFNQSSDGPVIYSLDGQAFRNGLAPAAIFTFAAIVRGEEAPKLVAIYSNENRNTDFRRPTSKPTYWRPAIVGHSHRHDQFLLQEVRPAIEQGRNLPSARYLMGHSLAGLYALDLATREPDAFDGFFAFAPTFSHDISIGGRLPRSCDSRSLVYANWGLESARDTEVFATTVQKWKDAPACLENVPITFRHFGSIHQIIMLTGHLHLAFEGLASAR